MPTLPVIDLTDTHLAILSTRALDSTPAQQALMGWCTAHGVDPATIPATAPIQVDPDAQTVTYERMVLADGKRIWGDEQLVTETVVHQVGHPIAPWPDEIIALAKAHTTNPTDLQVALAEIDKLKARVAEAERQLSLERVRHDRALLAGRRRHEQTQKLLADTEAALLKADLKETR